MLAPPVRLKHSPLPALSWPTLSFFLFVFFVYENDKGKRPKERTIRLESIGGWTLSRGFVFVQWEPGYRIIWHPITDMFFFILLSSHTRKDWRLANIHTHMDFKV